MSGIAMKTRLAVKPAAGSTSREARRCRRNAASAMARMDGALKINSLDPTPWYTSHNMPQYNGD
jgi:hypothetical protein